MMMYDVITISKEYQYDNIDVMVEKAIKPAK